MEHLSRPATKPEVSITGSGGLWRVTVRDAAGNVDVKNFKIEAFALNFAEGQRIRLGLDGIKRENAPSAPSDHAPIP